MLNKIGIIATIVFFIVNFTALHTLIPGVKVFRPGLLCTIILFFAILPEIRKINWYSPLGKWRLFFFIAIIPGIFFGFGTGKVRSGLVTNFQDFIGSFLALSAFFKTTESLRVLNKVILVCSGILAVFVITHSGQGPGILIDENDVGLVLVMLLPFVYFNIKLAPTKLKKALLYLLLFCLVLAVARTVSRGAMVGLLPTLFIIWFQSKKKIQTIFGVIIILSAVIFFGPPELLNEFKSIGDTNEGTAGSRRYFWQLSIELFKVRPVFGVGAGCWGNAVWSNLIYLPRHVSNMTPHSVYFQLISELGLVGIIAWGMLTFKTFSTGIFIKKMCTGFILHTDNIEEKDDLQFIMMFSNSLMVGLIGGLICGVFLSFLFYPHFYTFVALMQATYSIAVLKSFQLTDDRIVKAD